MSMLIKRCTECGVTCWHNEMKDGGHRCTFCGHPPGGNPEKKSLLTALRARKVTQARVMGITHSGVLPNAS